MKIALVHDHFLEFGGAERVAVALHDIFPTADVYTAAVSKSVTDRHIHDFNSWKVRTSWVAWIPFYKYLYSPLRFLAPYIWESFDFSKYDLVISSSGWFMSKGIKTKKPTKHISYIHHPPGYLYGYQTAMEWQRFWPIKIYASFINHFLRMWDFTSSQRADVLIANSQETQRRISKFYRRDSQVIYPPVAIENAQFHPEPSVVPYYVTVSRLAFKKHVDLLIKAANKAKFTLKVIGSGRDEAYLRSIAGDTVEILGFVPDEQFDDIVGGARAFLNAAQEEEFGIAPVEAMARGVPVIAFSSGGLKETVKNEKNGYLFEELSQNSLLSAITKLEKLSNLQYLAMRKTAHIEVEKYSTEVFEKKIRSLITQVLDRI